MKKVFFYASIIIILLSVTVLLIFGNLTKGEVREAYNLIERILPEYAGQFSLKLIGKDSDRDVFELEARGKRIIIRGSSGVSMCSGFNYYLKNYCNASYNFRCGYHLDIQGELPRDFEKVRKVSPYVYRYMFNYCTFSYSMAFWGWEQWEKMIDWMAMHGINMPLAPMGQEIIWQRVYKKYGLSDEDLQGFFVGPAYNAFGRMGCIDGFGGPLPQSWMENERILQKKILKRERRLGMTPVLQGFTGHVPSSFITKNPDLKFLNLDWADFPQTYLLDFEEPVFTSLGKDFIAELTKEYGTDHLYAIDQFIEMHPANGDTLFLKHMSEKIYSTLVESDPQGIWVLQTWPFKSARGFWDTTRTKAYFDGVPDERLIALELTGEYWKYTGWYKHDGWYGKPWIWSIISNFGDRVSMHGGLTQTAENLEKALSSQGKGNLRGLGLMMEGLDYNPVMYEYLTDMVWETQLPGLEVWKEGFLRSRYGFVNQDIINAWTNIFSHYYTKLRLFEENPINGRPSLIEEDTWPSEASVQAAGSLLNAADELKNIDAYRFDIVNLFREVFGQYAGHLLFEITAYYKEKNMEEFDESVARFISLSKKIEAILATREEFLLGKWIGESRERATNAEEEKLYEWNAKAIITVWGGRVLYGYALKDWAGMYSGYYLPRWEKFFSCLKAEMTGGDTFNSDSFIKDIILWEDNWVSLREEGISAKPSGDAIMLAKELWNEYGNVLLNH